MKSLIVALSLAVTSAALVPSIADARRLGGGGTSGMKRSLPAPTAPNSLPAKPAQDGPANSATNPAAAPGGVAGAPAAAPKRSWMGPIAGLAAGLGLAALLSHFGLGAGVANFLMMALLAVAAFALIRFVMRRFARPSTGLQYAGAGVGAGALNANGPSWQEPVRPLPMAQPLSSVPATPTGPALPAGFDAAGFERIAKMIFIRMQAANDAGDLNDLRNFTTPEMFAAVRLELQERGTAAQQTDVVRIDAQVLDVAEETGRQIVSVRFHGLIREEKDGTAAPFDEVWHLVKPTDGSREWAIAGIEQTEAA